MIVHFHGFASAGQGSKYRMLKECFPDQNIWSPNLPVNPAEFHEQIASEIDEHFDSLNMDIGLHSCLSDEPLTEEEIVHYHIRRVSVVGTSMGGFYALYVSAVFGIPALLINPVTNPSNHMRKYLGTQTNVKTGEKFEWKQEYLDTLKKMESKIQETQTVNERIFVAIGEKDQSVDPKQVMSFFSDQARIKLYPDDHRFLTWFPKVLKEREVQDLLTYQKVIEK